MTDARGSGPPPEQLRETLKKKTVPDLIEICKATGISGYSNKRKEELIDLLVFKKPRLDEQVDGHGLGLGIVRDIVEAWGGQLALQQSPLGGLRVSLNLPRKA